jgi:urease accessory protein
MLLNPTGGLVGGDFLLTQIIQEPNTHVCLTTPSATRVYRTLSDPAVQETLIQVRDGAFLEYLPDHVIPYRNSQFRQLLRVEMGRASRAILWDALASGRVACGERWSFDEVDSCVEISLCGRPIFLNRARICPANLDPDRLGFAEGFNYMATLVLVANELDGWKETTAALGAELRNIPQIHGGASELASAGCIVKLLARSASDLLTVQAALWARARQIVLGSPAIDLRKY